MSLLHVRDLSTRPGPVARLQKVSFRLGRGETLGVVGHPGAGKTTLLRVVLGLVRGGGTITLGGHPLDTGLRRHRVAYFAGEATIPADVRVRRWRSLFHDVDRAGDNRRACVLTQGARQLLGLRTIFALPALDLIVLDEPWQGLDPDAARWLSCAVRARREAGAALLLSSRRLHDLAGVCTHYLFLERGAATTIDASDLSPDGTDTADLLLSALERLRGSRMFRIVH